MEFKRVFTDGVETETLQRIRPYIALRFGYEWKFIGARITAQYEPMKMYVNPIDYNLINMRMDLFSSMRSRFNTIGVELYVRIGGNYD